MTLTQKWAISNNLLKNEYLSAKQSITNQITTKEGGMTSKTGEVFDEVRNSKDANQILCYCLGWIESHFNHRESMKEEEIRAMFASALEAVNKSQKTD